jgi:hypothetical protein
MGAMESCVEAGYLHNLRPVLQQYLYRRQIVVLVQGGERREGFQLGEDPCIDDDAVGKVRTAVHNAMTDCPRRLRQLASQPAAKMMLRGVEIAAVGRCKALLMQRCSVTAVYAQSGAGGANTADLAALDELQRPVGPQLIKMELEAGAAGIDDEEGVLHWMSLP